MSPLIPLLFLSACIEDVGKDKARAIVEAAPTEDVAKTTKGQTWPVDPSASKIGALGAKVTKAFPLVFHRFTGAIATQEGSVTAVSMNVAVDSVTSPHDRLTAHLLKEDFLWTERFPSATFDSTRITPGSPEEGATHTVTGTLEIRGKAKQITFPATLSVSESQVAANAEFAIDRQDFDVLYVGAADDLVQDSVVLTIEMVAPKH